MRPHMVEHLDMLADRYNLPRTGIIRRALERGLPLVDKSLKKQREQSAGKVRNSEV